MGLKYLPSANGNGKAKESERRWQWTQGLQPSGIQKFFVKHPAGEVSLETHHEVEIVTAATAHHSPSPHLPFYMDSDVQEQ